MKLSFLFMFFGLLHSYANSYSQTVRISMKLQNAELKEVISEIEKQTEFIFFYSPEDVREIKRIDVDVNNAKLDEILNECFDETEIVYEIKHKAIVLKKADKPKIKIEKRIEKPQEPILKGKVSDEKGVPLPGVSIVIKGTTTGTVTDVDGNYSFKNIPPQSTLEFSFIGMLKQDFAITNQTELDVVMKADDVGLEEVVVIGYGTMARRDLTGSVASVRTENTALADLPSVSGLAMVQGQIPGLNIGAVQSAGGAASFDIRGQNSISANNAPLLVLDGVMFSGSISQINPNDIASIDVLKDASSAAIYGSRAANGVIMITTKKGKTGKPVINFSTKLGINAWQDRPDIRKGDDFLKWRADNLAAGGYSDLSPESILEHPLEYNAYKEGRQIDWYDEITRLGIVQNYNLSMSGSTDKTNYYVSLGYINEEGVKKNDEFTRINLTSKIENQITDWLKAGVNINLSSRDYAGIAPSTYMATFGSPFGYLEVEGHEGLMERYPATTSSMGNPMWDTQNEDMDDRLDLNLLGYLKAEIPFVKGLSYRLNYRYKNYRREYGYFRHEDNFVRTNFPEDIANPSMYLKQAYGVRQDNTSKSWLLDNLLSYKREFGKHNVDALVGYTRDYEEDQTLYFSATDFEEAGTTTLGWNSLELGAIEQRDASTAYSQYSNVGYIGRLNYSYSNRYYLTFTFRRDGFSGFAEGEKFGNFPGASVAWTLSEEDFMSNIEAIDFLKLRMSYGANGNQGVSPYETFSRMGRGLTVFGSTSYPYVGPSSLSNKELSWEKTTAFNFGLDFSLVDRKLTGNVDLYKSETTDQLLTMQIPRITGYSSVRTNIGQVDNWGVELSLMSKNLNTKSGFKWDTQFAFSLNRNKLVSLYGIDANNDGVEDDDLGTGRFIGESLGAIYDYSKIGIVQQDDTEYINTYGAAPGDVKFADIAGYDENGEIVNGADGKIDPADRSVIGSRDPNFRFNIGNTLSYKNFELYFSFNCIAAGGKKNYYQAPNSASLQPYSAMSYVTNWLNVEYWTPETPSNTIPSVAYRNPKGYGYWDTRGFVRLQNVSLSYTFDKEALDLLGLHNLKVFATGTNLFTWSKWHGFDPENASTIRGGSPVMSTISFGFNASF